MTRIRLCHLRLAATLLTSASIVGTTHASAGGDPPIVFLIGVQHAPGLFYTESLSPGHVRAALDAIDPDVVGVESNPEWFARGCFYRFTYEAFGVTIPWAQSRKRSVVGIDWIGDTTTDWSERQRQARVDWEAANLKAVVDPRHHGYGTSQADQRSSRRAEGIPTFAYFNGPQHAADRIAWLDAEKHQPDTPQAYIALRDWHIAEYVAQAAKGARRMAVVIGADHLGNVTRELRARGIEVGDLPGLLAAAHAPFEGSADDHLSARDIAAILIESLDGDSGIAVDPAREARLLARLVEIAATAEPEVRDRLEHVQARQALLAGDVISAETRWTALADSGRATAFPFVGSSWRHRLTVQQLALLELGRLADVRGDRERAMTLYSRLLNTISVPAFSRDEHSDFELLARAHNAVRALLHEPYTHALAFPTRQMPTAVAANAAAQPRPALTAAWEHLRARRWTELEAAVQNLASASDLSSLEALEYRYLATTSALEAGHTDQARGMLAHLEREASDLTSDHWLRRELPSLRSRLKPERERITAPG